MKNILIVGATGFIGYHLAHKCKKHFKVFSISTKKPLKKRLIKGVKYIILDISKKKNFKKIIKYNFNYVVNLGGYVDHKNKTKTFSSHYEGTKNLINFFKSKKLEKFIQIGSSAEYGKLKSPQLENSKCNPRLNYGLAKLKSTIFAISQFKKVKFPVSVLRLYQVYGPKQEINRFIPIIINECRLGKNFPCSDGTQKRDFTYISDVVEAIVKCLPNKKAEGEIINIGTGKSIMLKNIIKYMQSFYKKGTPLYGKIKLRKDEILDIKPNIKKAKNILNWKPKINFKHGIKKTLEYYNNY